MILFVFVKITNNFLEKFRWFGNKCDIIAIEG